MFYWIYLFVCLLVLTGLMLCVLIDEICFLCLCALWCWVLIWIVVIFYLVAFVWLTCKLWCWLFVIYLGSLYFAGCLNCSLLLLGGFVNWLVWIAFMVGTFYVFVWFVLTYLVLVCVLGGYSLFGAMSITFKLI